MRMRCRFSCMRSGRVIPMPDPTTDLLPVARAIHDDDEFTDLIAMLQRCQAREAGNAGDTVNALEENENGNDTGI
jgi:hypothetical protein